MDTPSTFTVSVFTRHSPDCPQKDNPLFKRCNCRKSLYLYEHGQKRVVSAKTRSWEQAERLAQQERDARDPVQNALRKIAEKEEAKETAQRLKEITVTEALGQWLDGEPKNSRSQMVQFNSLASKLRGWAKEKGILHLSEIKPGMLYAWLGTWSAANPSKRDRLGPSSHNLYLANLRRFFRWTVGAEYLERDPTLLLKRKKHIHIQTQPLTPEQFEEVLAATYRLDENRYPETPEYGRDLRAIFLLQRWTGMRLIDALTLKRRGVRNKVLSITTHKVPSALERTLPTTVIAALAEIPPRSGVRPECYFWTLESKANNLTITWTERIKRLNRYLKLTDEEGKPMQFRSHMLRDTFAVELLLAGMPLDMVSKALTHKSVLMTEKYYAPWVKKRQQQFDDGLHHALRSMGATF